MAKRPSPTGHHPAGAQQLTVDIATADGQLSGTVVNPALGITAQIINGTVAGDRITCTTVLTTPFEVTIGWDGTVRGDSISGQATISSAGTFPFDGTRQR